MEKKKFYAIVGTNYEFKALTMLDIRVMAKLGSVTNQTKSEDRLEGIKKDRKY